MTVYSLEPNASNDVAQAINAIVPASAFFIAALARIVDLSQLTVGDDEQDYFVPIPSDRLHEVSLRIAQLQVEVQDRFGVQISVLPIPMQA
jgi:hypothetical protein